MNSRDNILALIKKNKPSELPLPDTFFITREVGSEVKRFIEVLQSIGGKVEQVNNLQAVQDYLQQQSAQGHEVVNGVTGIYPNNLAQYTDSDALAVEAVHTVVLKGALGVAENGSVWLSEEAMGNRLLPFICQELVVVVEPENIVADMHQAYQKITIDTDGYGVFIAGPSKTADIEQSLVIGAHGPLAMTVYLATGTSPQ
ncbi:MAG TPA: LUD domain-containing protein [Flavisolibacter sp.]|nr:LUD domain-containing protein [Flavisolibacter sp.]